MMLLRAGSAASGIEIYVMIGPTTDSDGGEAGKKMNSGMDWNKDHCGCRKNKRQSTVWHVVPAVSGVDLS